MTAFQIVAIGASWGGLEALGVVLAGLPAHFRPAIVVAQHRGSDGPAHLAQALSAKTSLTVIEPYDKDALETAHVYVAPPGYHLLVDRDTVSLSTDEPERFSRPSIDVLFESVADTFAEEAIGVILTGASDDGSAGLARMRRRGALTIAQEPATAARPRMPEAAIAAGGVGKVLPLADIAAFLVTVNGDGA